MKNGTINGHMLMTLLQGAIEAASEGIVVLDHQTDAVLLHNNKFMELFSFDQNSSEPKSVLKQLEDQLLKPQELNNMIEASKLEPFQEYECELSLNESKQFKIIKCRTSPIITKKNDLEIILGRSWYFTDVTDTKLQEKRMLESAKMAALGELAGGIAHEINNPMTMIKNYSKKVSRIVEKNSGFEEHLAQLNKAAQSISHSTERVISIVSGLRNISKNEDITAYETTSLSAIISEVKDLSMERVNKHDIKLIIDINQNSFIHCNRVQIYQVIINLVNNAIDSIVEANIADRWIRIGEKIENGSISIMVQDSGPGVNQQAVEKIFNPFFSTKDADKGTGLGLSLSKEIIQNHNGDLSYHDQEGTSTFTAILPLVS